jgi:hypothetical protein
MNARQHPQRQRRALASALTTIGLIQDVIVNKRSGYLLDGHLRVDLAKAERQPVIPVKYVDLSEEEEALVLATFDPVASLAYLDMEEIASLRDDLAGSLEAPLAELITELAPAIPDPQPAYDDEGWDDDPAPAGDRAAPGAGAADEDDGPLAYTLFVAGRTVPMTQAEFKNLTNAFFAYLDDYGMAFGFVRWLTA